MTRVVRAAGCVVWRAGVREPEVLLVHRPRWQDWSFPKGKLDDAEDQLRAAVREVQEETGLRVQLGPRLPDLQYPISGGQEKHVAYWAARAPSDTDISTFAYNDEIDDLVWCQLSKARSRLCYPYDGHLLDAFAASPYSSQPLVIVRHGQARSRKTWRGEDGERPLRAEGVLQADRLVSLLQAYRVTSIVSSDALRCVDTVLPYVNLTGAKLKLDPALSQEQADESRIVKRLDRLLKRDESMAVCSHRPVLPTIFAALELEPVALDPGQILVAHREKGRVVDTEVHRP